MNKSVMKAAVGAAAVSSLLLLSGCSNNDSSSSTTTSAASSSTTSEAGSGASSTTTTGAAAAGGSSSIESPSGPVTVDPAVFAKYTELGGATGKLGAISGPSVNVAGGTETKFANGTIFYSAATGAHLVQGEILRVYTEKGGPAGSLKFPKTDETALPNGWESVFEGGTITWTNKGGTFAETVTPA